MSNHYPSHLMQQLELVLASCPLVPVIRIDAPEHAVPLGKALFAGGIRVLEITLRTRYGVAAIRELRAALPDAWVGAGTVASVEDFRQVEAAGAHFVISPGMTPSLLEYGLGAKCPFLPGIATLSEMMLAREAGYSVFKFFPAEVSGGVEALKAFSGPFPDVRFVPTGGITPATASRYLSLPSVPAVGGSWLTPSDRIQAGDWAGITEVARSSLAQLDS